MNVPMTVGSDGSQLIEQTVFIGGHPEWESGVRMIGVDNRLIIYDSSQQRLVEELATPTVFPDPENDVALSPDGNWLSKALRTAPAMPTLFTAVRTVLGLTPDGSIKGTTIADR